MNCLLWVNPFNNLFLFLFHYHTFFEFLYLGIPQLKKRLSTCHLHHAYKCYFSSLTNYRNKINHCISLQPYGIFIDPMSTQNNVSDSVSFIILLLFSSLLFLLIFRSLIKSSFNQTDGTLITLGVLHPISF